VRILITAGPTREYIDSVRFLSNASSGLMGYAVAAAAQARGHEVVLISGPVALPAPVANVVRVESAAEMLQAAQAAFSSCDAAVMTAAVADFRPAQPFQRKAPKPAGVWELKLEPTPDICAALGAAKQHRVVVGFALQDDDAHFRAEQKLLHKRCDAIVLNGPQTLGSPRTRQQFKVAGEPWREPFEASKAEAAERIVALVEELAARSGPAR
jgi:phosphopantothenoylcysteine decarboxylase/phosphopantothenate--cysteine ligase